MLGLLLRNSALRIAANATNEFAGLNTGQLVVPGARTTPALSIANLPAAAGHATGVLSGFTAETTVVTPQIAGGRAGQGCHRRDLHDQRPPRRHRRQSGEVRAGLQTLLQQRRARGVPRCAQRDCRHFDRPARGPHRRDHRLRVAPLRRLGDVARHVAARRNAIGEAREPDRRVGSRSRHPAPAAHRRAGVRHHSGRNGDRSVGRRLRHGAVAATGEYRGSAARGVACARWHVGRSARARSRPA